MVLLLWQLQDMHPDGYREFGRDIRAGDTSLRAISRRVAEILGDCGGRLFSENGVRNPDGTKQR